MSEEQADALGRLEAAIGEWQQQLARDHQEMIDHIVQTRHQVEEQLEQIRAQLDGLRQQAASSEGSALAEGGDQFLSPEDVRSKLEVSVFDEQGHRLRMGEILVSAGIISDAQLREALEAQTGQPQRRLGDLLIEMGYTGEDVIAQVLASQLNLPFVRIGQTPIDIDVLRLLSPKLARMHHCIPLRATDSEIVVAMSNPLDLIAIDDVELASNRRVSVSVATTGDVTQAIEHNYLNVQGESWL